MASRNVKLTETLPPDLKVEVERAVRAAGALSLARLTKQRLAPSARSELEQQLVAAGLERTPKAMRVPIGEQIVALLQGGRHLPQKDLARRVKGGAKKEICAALDRLVHAGRVGVVVRTSVEVLVEATARALAPEELAALVTAHATLGKVLKKVGAKGGPRSILREDLVAMLDPLHRLLVPGAPTVPVADLVGRALRRLAVLDLVRVPDLVRALGGEVPLADVHRALLEAHDSGIIELRPEAGSEFLSEDDARLCPPGPRGTVFSYAALVKP